MKAAQSHVWLGMVLLILLFARPIYLALEAIAASPGTAKALYESVEDSTVFLLYEERLSVLEVALGILLIGFWRGWTSGKILITCSVIGYGWCLWRAGYECVGMWQDAVLRTFGRSLDEFVLITWLISKFASARRFGDRKAESLAFVGNSRQDDVQQ